MNIVPAITTKQTVEFNYTTQKHVEMCAQKMGTRVQ